ncbi:MAG TPA: capsular biosynthesis protein [Flavobacteriaceae bacterium]|nr:capsular biosynthesis protein [Flavobacteriaceae bacterium]MAY53918.1 capsular biosynthesis protein [Flavobacteriaceae bacterium]HBR55446.1 capsular biosynthesis protein [Flavobacteriaceae bacterium]
MKLAIISHTEHYRNAQGRIVGWGPTVSELNHLATHFDEIYHVAMLHDSAPPPSSLPYLHDNITFVPLPPSGGTSFLSKLKTIAQAPKTIAVVRNTLKKVDVFQLRTPTGMGVYLVPYLTWFSQKKGWYKYAGNWNQEHPPLGYRLQRRFLKKQSRKVTINGSWEDQPAHCYTFENPCLTISERSEGISVIKQKQYDGPFSFCFVGRLDNAKGVQRIIDAFSKFENKLMVARLHFIGNGDQMVDYKKQCAEYQIPAIFHGFLPREKVFNVYRDCQFLMLPSTASEGFPKVIAEGMNFGCIPIVSNVSSIGQYIDKSNGYVVTPTTAEELWNILVEIKQTNKQELLKKATQGYATASKFTFEHYNSRILNEIIAT